VKLFQNKTMLLSLYVYLRHFPAQGDRLNDGLTKVTHGLCAALAKGGAQVTILCESSATEDSICETEAGYRVRCFANPIQHRPSFNLSPSLRQFLQETDFQHSLFVLNGILHPTIYSVSHFLRRRGIFYIVAPHDVYHPRMFQKNRHLKIPYWFLLERRVLGAAKAIQVLSFDQARFLQDRGVKTPIFEVTNGLHEADLCPEESLIWSEGTSPRIFSFGRLDAHHKGLDLLIPAFAEFSDRVAATLTLQGPDGGSKAQLKHQVNHLDLGDRVEFLDPEYGSAAAIISRYDIFCLPSRFEGFGLTALEAMVAGRVLLVSREAGIARHVETSGCGVVVGPEPTAISAGLWHLHQRRTEWKAMGLRGRHYALRHLNWQVIGKTALDHYQHVVAGEQP
jgi:glycosyltransferase involved in cell wall biosynthesis